MNKYIDKVTVSEYKTINRILKNTLYDYEENYKAKTMTQQEKVDFIELKFITRKIEKIIKDFSK